MTMTKVWQHRGQFAPGGLTQIKGPIYWARILRAFVSPATDNGTGYLSSPGAAWREIGSTAWNPIYGRDVYHPSAPLLTGLEICGMSADVEYCTDGSPMEPTDYAAHDGWDLLLCNQANQGSPFQTFAAPPELSGNTTLGCPSGVYTFDCTELLGIVINSGNGAYNLEAIPYDDTIAPVAIHPAGSAVVWGTVAAMSGSTPSATRAYWGLGTDSVDNAKIAAVPPIFKVFLSYTTAPTTGWCRFYLYGRRR
jgi:hypothetical protein